MPKKLVVIMPVFNEEVTVFPSISRVLAMKMKGVKIDLVVVNDGSTDKTRSKLLKLKSRRIKVLSHKFNQGKGTAIRTALANTKGDLYIIQDADLEYDPKDINQMIEPILAGKADVVFGSRFVGSNPHRVLYFWHRVANQLITFICDCVTNLNLTDIETGYKAFTGEVAEVLDIQENRFGFDPEFTIKVARNNFRIYEVGVSYAGRSYEEGKKITWKDGVMAIWTIIKYSLFE